MSTEFGLLMIGCTIGVCWDLLWRGIKWLIEKCVDYYYDWDEKRAVRKRKPDGDNANKWEEFKEELRQKALEMGYVWDKEDRKYKKIASDPMPPGSYTTGGDMDLDQKERTRDTFEHVKMPMERVISPAGKVYDWPDVRHPDFKKSFDVPMVDLFAKISEACQQVSWTVRIAELKRRKFSPSSNPLGDTAAFMVDKGFPFKFSFDFASQELKSRNFRHRKGGRRG